MADDFDTQHTVETYKSLITISIEGFKYLALVNGGAVVTLLNFALNAKKTGNAADLVMPTAWFVAGLLSCGLSLIFSYATQYCLYNEAMKRFREGCHQIPLWLAALTLIASLGCFAAGCYFSIPLAKG